jgi:hypothetical protein
LEAENKTVVAEVKRLDDKCKVMGRDSREFHLGHSSRGGGGCGVATWVLKAETAQGSPHHFSIKTHDWTLATALAHGTDGYIKIDHPSVWHLDSHFEALLAFFCLPYNSYNPKIGKRREIVDRLLAAAFYRRTKKSFARTTQRSAEALPRVKEPGALGAMCPLESGLSQSVRRSMTTETNRLRRKTPLNSCALGLAIT